MKLSSFLTTWAVALLLVSAALAEDECHYMKSRSSLSGYETGGPYALEHFRLTKGRMDLREFLWKHWHDGVKGVAEARVGTIDAGTVTAIYVVQPDAQGKWGIDVEIDRPRQTSCLSFHAHSLIRIPIRKPDEDYPSQTVEIWPPDKVPKERLADSKVEGAKFWRIVLVTNEKAVGDTI
jgi:hypothetical protein